MTADDHLLRINRAQNGDRLEVVLQAVEADKSLSAVERAKLMDRGQHRRSYFVALLGA